MSPLCRREGRRRSLALGGGRCQQAWETLLSEDLLELYEASPLGVSELVFFFSFFRGFGSKNALGGVSMSPLLEK